MADPIILNKIDPVIISNVQQQTVDGVVHTSDKIRVAKDKKEKKGQSFQKSIKSKLAKLNSYLKSKGIDVIFAIDDDGAVTAYDKDGNAIKTFIEDEVDGLLSNMDQMAGIFIDLRK
ncbi:MAG TPA: hypothetical protein DD429_05195 [Clostridiaceae bacterium]|jgi:uncharacterized FlaG/YvyC family protein|nr:hypothetical protein [Clostridiaceae bacterium]